MTTKKDETQTHPSWAMARFSRITRMAYGLDGKRNRRQLFGSRVHDHPSSILLTIKRAERSHDLAHDWVHGTEDLIEVEFSASQFVELLTAMNVGDGVPCTIRWFGGPVEEMPPEDTESHRTREYFTKTMGEIGDRLRKLISHVKLLEEKGTLSVAQRKAIAGDVQMLIQEVEKNIPFVADSFQGVTDKMTTEAKAEVDSFVTMTMARLGFDSLRQLAETVAEATGSPKEIEGGGEGGT